MSCTRKQVLHVMATFDLRAVCGLLTPESRMLATAHAMQGRSPKFTHLAWTAHAPAYVAVLHKTLRRHSCRHVCIWGRYAVQTEAWSAHRTSHNFGKKGRSCSTPSVSRCVVQDVVTNATTDLRARARTDAASA